MPALKKMGLPLDKVARLISSVFCEQVRSLLFLCCSTTVYLRGGKSIN